MHNTIEKHDRIADRPYLRLMESSVCKIPERLEEYDPGFFLVINLNTQNIEVHSLANIGNSYCFAVPFETLDARTLAMVERNDLKKKSLKAIVAEMDAKNDALEKNNARCHRDDVKAAALEMRPMFKKFAEEVY